jgi:hypothetical protein
VTEPHARATAAGPCWCRITDSGVSVSIRTSSGSSWPGLDRDGRDELKEAAQKYLELGGEVSEEAFGMFRKAVADDTKANARVRHGPG